MDKIKSNAPIETTVDPKVKELKDSGNEAFKNENFKESIYFYTQAISTPDVPDKELAILHSNRSVAFLKLRNISSAEENAIKSIELLPTWWKGYYRLAMVDQANEKFESAYKNLLISQKLHENPKNLEAEIKYLKGLIKVKSKIKTGYVPVKSSVPMPSPIWCREIDTSTADRYKVSITLAHRKDFKGFIRYPPEIHAVTIAFGSSMGLKVNNLKPRPKINLSDFKPILLEEMSKEKKSQIYQGFFLRLTIMEDPIDKDSAVTAIYSIVRDEKYSYERLFIYNYSPNKTELQENLGFGSKISIVNPYYRISLDGSPLLRVDDFNTVIIHSDLKNEKICRYCGNENYEGPPILCRFCKRSYYCSQKCLKLDVSELRHNFVCKK